MISHRKHMHAHRRFRSVFRSFQQKKISSRSGDPIWMCFSHFVSSFFLFIFRLFAIKRCNRCQMGISASELVMRAKDMVFHLNCFTCTSCGIPLSKGDHFGMRNGLVRCVYFLFAKCPCGFLKRLLTPRYTVIPITSTSAATTRTVGIKTFSELEDHRRTSSAVAAVKEDRVSKREDPGRGSCKLP